MSQLSNNSHPFVCAININLTSKAGIQRAAAVYLISESSGDAEYYRMQDWYKANIESVLHDCVSLIGKPIYNESDIARCSDAAGHGAEELATIISQKAGINTSCIIAEPFDDGTKEHIINPLARDMVAYSACFAGSDGTVWDQYLLVLKVADAAEAARMREVVREKSGEVFRSIDDAAHISRNAIRKVKEKLIPYLTNLTGATEAYSIPASFFLEWRVEE